MSLLALVDVAQRLLDTLVAAAADEGIELPERRFVTAGAAGGEAWDGEQVTVGLQQLIPANASKQGVILGQATQVTRGALPMTAAALRIEIVRCHPTMKDDGRPPAAEDEQAAGETALRDAALLHELRNRAIADAALTGGESGDLLPGPVTPAGPEGALAGMAMVLTVTALAVET